MKAAKVTETKVVTTGVSLELTMKEAEDLARIVYHIGGSPTGTPRGTAELISIELERLGVRKAGMSPTQSMLFPSSSMLR